jgi:hypothetical protein
MFLPILLPPSAHSGGAVIDNASLLADFALARDKSIAFCREDESKCCASHAVRLVIEANSDGATPDFMAKNNHRRHDQADDKQEARMVSSVWYACPEYT